MRTSVIVLLVVASLIFVGVFVSGLLKSEAITQAKETHHSVAVSVEKPETVMDAPKRAQTKNIDAPKFTHVEFSGVTVSFPSERKEGAEKAK